MARTAAADDWIDRRVPSIDGIRVGIGGWTFPPWRDNFYPRDLVQRRELEFASRHLSSIEINGTYYGTQKPATYAKWRDETPDGFVFSAKAPKRIMQARDLARVGPQVEDFIDGIAALGDRLGPLVWQFEAGIRLHAESFAAFCALLPREAGGRPLRHVLDVRDPAFVDAGLLALARRHGLATVFTDSPEYPSFADLGADFAYARLMRSRSAIATGYPEAGLAAWARRARQWASGAEPNDLPRIAPPATPAGHPREVFVYFIGAAKERNPAAAMALIQRLAGSCPGHAVWHCVPARACRRLGASHPACKEDDAMTTRRQFLTRAAWTAAAMSLPIAACARGQQAAAPAAATAVPASLLSRTIPSTGEVVPAIGAGTSGSYEVALDSPEFAALKEVARLFFEGGGRVIDTSPNYGNAEDVVGALLAEGGWRDRCFLATKLAADDRTALEAQWTDSLRRLRTDKVELLAVHNLRNLDQALAYARELKAAGKVKYVGLTHFRDDMHDRLREVMLREKPDFIQVNYSVTAPNAAKALLPAAADAGVAVMINRAFDDGRLFARSKSMALPSWAAELGITSWAQMFLRFVLSHPAVTVVIPATGKPERQADNLKGGTGPLLDAAQQAELVRLFA